MQQISVPNWNNFSRSLYEALGKLHVSVEYSLDTCFARDFRAGTRLRSLKKKKKKKKRHTIHSTQKVTYKHNFILIYVSPSFVAKFELKKCPSIVRILKQFKRNIIFTDGRLRRFSEYGVLVKTIPFEYLV